MRKMHDYPENLLISFHQSFLCSPLREGGEPESILSNLPSKHAHPGNSDSFLSPKHTINPKWTKC
jgi:hypothetical protein